MAEEDKRRYIPESSIDFNLMVTEPEWGKDTVDISQEPQKFIDSEGKSFSKPKTAWNLLSFFTKDMRLSNLGKQEMVYCKHYVDLAADFLAEGKDFHDVFSCALERAASQLELSQSLKGFLREIINTLRTENIQKNLEPAKKSWLGKKTED